MTNSSFSSGLEAASNIRQKRLSQQKLMDDQYKGIGDRLTEAMMEPDETMRSIAVDSILKGAEQLTGRPMSKEFRSFIKQSPEDAATVFKNIQDRGISPEVVFRVQDNPLLFGHAMIALGKAKRERMARAERGGEAGETPGAPTAQPSPSEQPEQFGEGQAAPQALPTQPAQGPQPAATGAMPAEAAAAPESPVTAEKAKVEGRVASLGKRINALASMGRPEAEITPLRTERATLERELRDINIGPAMAASRKQAELGVEPVGREDVALGVEAAQRGNRPDIAARFKPGMPRQAFDALLGQVGTTQTQGSQPSAPTPANASPMQAPLSPMPEEGAGPQAAKPTNLVQTPAEAQREKDDIQRRARTLDKDIMRDPAVIQAGVKTQGELEDAIAKGTVKIQDLSTVARQQALATAQATTTVKDFETIKTEGMHARNIARYYDILGAAAEHAGPRGPWVTPMRETINNFANTMGIKNPWGQSKMQLMEAISNKLIPELTMQFKGSQSDREFMAGLASAPSVRNTEHGFAILLYASREMNKVTQEQDLQARKWVAKYKSLDATDSKGNDFQTSFDEALRAYEDKAGTLQERISKAFKIKPENLLKGNLTPER